MADKGFDIVYDLMSIGVKLNVPPKLRIVKAVQENYQDFNLSCVTTTARVGTRARRVVFIT